MKMNSFVWKELDETERQRLLKRSASDVEQVLPSVRDVIDRVRQEGDAALRDYTLRFDDAEIGRLPLAATREEFDEAERKLSAEVKEALRLSVDNVRKFHRNQQIQGMSLNEIRPGVFAGERLTPIESVGLYVPQGRGSFPSMLYMLAVPARIAGVERICVTTPPMSSGAVDAACLYAARLCEVDEVYRIGGPQALAALTYGTESIRPVHKLVGPGSTYIAAAKQLLAHDIDVGPPAGPSESIILADDSADPWYVSLDLMIEAEHGSDSSALLVTTSAALAEQVRENVAKLLKSVPEPRKSFLEDVFSGYGGIVIAEDLSEGADIVNEFAPEHLQIQTADPYDTISHVRNAGEILLGMHTPFSLANYAAGANAVLPTGRTARTYSGVSVRDFVKYSSIVHVTARGRQLLTPHVVALADYEGFFMHAEALRRRDST